MLTMGVAVKMEQRQTDMVSRNLDYKMAWLDKLVMIWSKYPKITDAQIIKHLPGLENFMDINTGNINMASI